MRLINADKAIDLFNKTTWRGEVCIAAIADASGNVFVWHQDTIDVGLICHSSINAFNNLHDCKITHWATPMKGPEFYEQK